METVISKKDFLAAGLIALAFLIGVIGIIMTYFWTRDVQKESKEQIEKMPGLDNVNSLIPGEFKPRGGTSNKTAP
jgi:hypothetical protein